MINNVSVVGDSSIDQFLLLDGQEACLMAGKHNKKELCLNYGEKTSISSRENFFGGSALNVSVVLSKLGKNPNISTILGSDFDGKEVLNFLNSNKIDTSEVEVKGKTNQSVIICYKSERTILSYHEKRDYSKLKIPRSEIIHFTSAGQGSEKMIDKIRKNVQSGSKLVFNPGSYEISSFDLFKPLMPLSTIFIINRLEANQIIYDTADIIAQLDKILKFGTKVAIITDAKNGAYFGTSQGHFHINSAPGNVIDPTGAGDAFSATLTAGLMNGKSLEESAIGAMYNSASVISSYGSNSSLLTMDEIDNLVKGNKILKFSRV